jgi:hypothetical protein
MKHQEMDDNPDRTVKVAPCIGRLYKKDRKAEDLHIFHR